MRVGLRRRCWRMRNYVNRSLQNLRAGVKVQLSLRKCLPLLLRPVAEMDLGSRFAAQYDQISLDIDTKMDKLSSSLLGQISLLIAQLHHPNPLVSVDTSGYSGAHTEPEPPQPLDKSASAGRRESLVHEGGTGARVSGLAQVQRFSSDRVYKPRVAQPPGFQEDLSGVPSGSGGNSGGREHRVDDDDDDLEDKESVAGAPVDGYFARLVDYIYDQFPHSKPHTAVSVKPRCEYEEFFSVSDPPEPARKFMKLYPRVSEIQSTSSEHVAKLSRESHPLFKILPLRCRAVSIGDDLDFCNQRFLNSDYLLICRSKSVPKSRSASINLSDLERGARMILAGDSQCFWFLSALLARLKDDGYRPSNPSLFDNSISALSAAQTSVAANMSEYVTTKRRESYLAHASFTLPDNLKRELLVAPGTGSLLFNQSLLEDSLLSSTSSLATLSKAAVKNKSQGGTSRYNSPLDAPRAGSSGFRKRSLPVLVGARSGVVAAGVGLLPQLRATVFGGRSHAPVQPQ